MAPVAEGDAAKGPVAGTPALPPVTRHAWAQAHIDSWTADRIPHPNLKGEAHVSTDSAPWTPDTTPGEPSIEADRSIDEEFDQGRHHTVTA